MHYPTKVCICILRDGTKIYQNVANKEEYEELCHQAEKEKEYVRDCFKQYRP